MAADPHLHAHDHVDLDTDPQVARILRGIVAVIVILTAIGLLVWRGDNGFQPPDVFGGQGDRVNATVVRTGPTDCAGVDPSTVGRCISVEFEVTSGPNAGGTGSIEMYPDVEQVTPAFGVGDKIVVNEFELGDTGQWAYSFADFQRTGPLIVLAIIFVVAVVALGRIQGLRAILGLVITGFVLLLYVFPALLDGQPPLAVALVASSIIAMAALYLAHGVNDTTTVALLGTLGALGLTGLLGWIFTNVAQITGLASEDQILLLASSDSLDVRGLVLAGIILGSLGVLDDVTVTQVSAVASLREANPGYGVRQLYTSGLRIGRDHIASVVNTLALAYAGAALPLLLFYTNIGLGMGEAVTQEIVAVEVVRTLVGSIGLISAVPLTTGLAAIVVTGTGFRRNTDHDHDDPDAGADPDDEVEDEESGWDRFTPAEEEF